MTDDTPVLEIKDLVVEYRYGGLLPKKGGFRAVDGLSLRLGRGKTLALVGESGSGKTTVARAVLGLAPRTAGRISLLGRELARGGAALRQARQGAQMVFQQPSGSLNPRMRIGDTVAEPLVHLLGMKGPIVKQRVGELLEMVGLDQSFVRRVPRQLSGGQRQRVAIARALAPSPSLLICDEPTSSLDVSVQAQIVNLLNGLRDELNISMLFISHDLGIVRQIADEMAVMYRGEIVEAGPVGAILEAPVENYTRTLLESVPSIDKALQSWTEHGEAMPNAPH